MIIYFDTETTGLYPGRIIQLAYIIEKESGITAKNFYFYVDYIEPSASEVHGITVEKLLKLSKGDTFSTHSDEIFDDFYKADLVVAHNFKFDLNFLIAEFRYIDTQFRYNESFDSMKYFTPILKLKRSSGNAYKYPKLQELCEFLDIFSYDISRNTKQLFFEYVLGNHDARFDTSAMYLAVVEGRKRYDDLRKFFLERV